MAVDREMLLRYLSSEPQPEPAPAKDGVDRDTLVNYVGTEEAPVEAPQERPADVGRDALLRFISADDETPDPTEVAAEVAATRGFGEEPEKLSVLPEHRPSGQPFADQRGRFISGQRTEAQEELKREDLSPERTATLERLAKKSSAFTGPTTLRDKMRARLLGIGGVDAPPEIVEPAAAEASEALARPAAILSTNFFQGLSLGQSRVLERWLGLKQEDLAPMNQKEAALAGMSNLLGTLITAGGIAKKIGGAVAPLKSKLARVVLTRMGTASIVGGSNQLANLATGQTTLKRAGRDFGISMAVSLVNLIPEQGLKAGVGNWIGQVATDLVADFTADKFFRGRLKNQSFKEWFLRDELPQLWNSLLFATADLKDPNFEAHRQQVVGEIKQRVRGDWNAKTKGVPPPPIAGFEESIKAQTREQGIAPKDVADTVADEAETRPPALPAKKTSLPASLRGNAPPAPRGEGKPATSEERTAIREEFGDIRDLPTTQLRRLASDLGVEATGGKKQLVERIIDAEDQAPAESLKTALNRVTGVSPQDRTVVSTERALEKARLRAEARGAKRAGAVARVETRAEIRAQVRQKKFDFKLRRQKVIDHAREVLAKFEVARVKAIADRATTPKGLENAMLMVDRLLARQESRASQADFHKTLKQLKKTQVRPEFQKTIDQLLDDFDPKILSADKTLRLQALKTFVEKTPDHNVPPELVAEIHRLNKVSISEMTTDDVRNLTAALKAVQSQNSLKKRLIVRQKNRPVQEHADEFVKELEANPIRAKEARQGLPKAVGGFLKGAKLAHMNLESVLEGVDGGKAGPASDIVFGQVKGGQENRAAFNAETKEYLVRRYEDAGVNRDDILRWSQPLNDRLGVRKLARVGGKRVAKYAGAKAESVVTKLDSGKTLEMTYGETAKMWRDSKNTRNLRNILDAEHGGIRLGENETELFKVTPGDLERIFAQLPDAVKKAADINHEYENTVQKDRGNEASRERVGADLFIEDDYSHLDRSQLDRHRLGVQKGTGPAVHPADQGIDDRGWLKERTGVIAPVVIRDEFAGFFHRTRNVNHYAAMAEPLAVARAFMSDKGVKGIIQKRHGKQTLDSINRAINDIENPPRVGEEWYNKALETGRRKIVTAVLGVGGVAGGVALKQPVSFLQASAEMKWKYLGGSLARALPSKARVAESNPILSERLGGRRVERDVGGTDSALTFWTDRTTGADKMMRPISYADSLAIRRIWSAADLEVRDQQPNLRGAELEKAIGRRAEEVVRKTQPVFSVEDRSELSRNPNVFWRMATTFTAQLNQDAQILMRGVDRFANSDKTAADVGKLANVLLVVGVAAPFAISAVNELRDSILEKAGMKKRKNKQALAARLALETVKNRLRSVYVAGDFIGDSIDVALGQNFQDPEFINNIVARTAAQAGRAGGGLLRDVATRDWGEQTVKDAKRLAIALNNMATGLPVGPGLKHIGLLLRGIGVIDPDDGKPAEPAKRAKTQQPPIEGADVLGLLTK